MNKIFRVIWNNAKHCYVVASELAKSYSKGGGSRSIRRAMAALCISVAVYATSGNLLAANSGGHIDGDDYIGDSPNYNVTIDSSICSNVYGRKEDTADCKEASATMTGGTLIRVYGGYTKSGAAASNSVNISGGSTTEVYGGLVNSGSGKATSNSVYISGGTIGSILCGRSSSGEVASNSININGGTINSNVKSGYSYSGIAASNSVNISGGTINNVFGAHSYLGKAETNSVNIVGGEVNTVYGGYSDYIGNITNNNVIISGGLVHNNVYGGFSYNNYTSSNSVNISGESTQIDGSVYGGAGNVNPTNLNCTGSASFNLVNISGGKIGENVYGGFTINGDAASNSVNINSGTIGMDLSKGEVYGGYVKEGTGVAVSNSVSINNGTVNQQVIGGYSYSGIASNNSIKISGGTVNNNVFGGFVDLVSGAATSNSVSISGGTINGSVQGGYVNFGSGDANSNSVNISDGTIHGSVYGAFMENGSGNATSNSVNISGGTITEFYDCGVYGGYSNSGASTYNSVIISGNTAIIRSEVYGGYTTSGNAVKNTVNLSNGVLESSVFGGNVRNGTGDAAYNSIIINNETVRGFVYGGCSNKGTASSNSVSIKGNSSWVLNNVYGGTSTKESAICNLVTINNGTVVKDVYGGWSELGNATNNSVNTSGYANIIGNISGGWTNSTGYANFNEVSIKDDTVVDNIFGGWSSGYSNCNSVNISGGFVKEIYGGWSHSGNSASNSVTINGITSFKNVYGGYSESGNSTSNSVNISVGSFDSESKIYAGYVKEPNNSKISENVVNLGGKATRLNNSEIYGYFFESGSGTHSDNELHIGRTVDYDDEGKIKRDSDGSIIYKSDKNTIWQSESNIGTQKNKVKTVANFETIALHSVAWDTSLPALEATTITDVDSLDITDLKFYSKVSDEWKAKTLEYGDSMALIKSADSLNLNLVYMDNGTKKTIEAANFDNVAIKEDFSESNAVNGVKLSGTEGKTISLIDNKKTIQFSYDLFLNKISFDKNQPVSFSNGSINRDLEGKSNFSDNTTIDATDLTFADSSTLLKANDSMTLVDNATGITAETSVTNGTDKTIGISYIDSASEIVFGAKATGKVRADIDSVKYTIEFVAGESINLADWNGSAEAYPDEWNVDAKGVIVAGIFEDPGLKTGESINILTASTAIFKDENIDESIRYADGAFNNALENGVSHSGYQTGGVKATEEGKALTYFTMEKTIDKFDLANWDGEKAVFLPTNWTINDGASIETDGMINLPDSDEEKQVFILKSDTDGFFANVAINGENAYGKKQNKFTDSDEAERVVLSGIQEKGVTFDSAKTNLVYKLGSKDVTSLKLNTIRWEDGAEILSRDKYNYSKLTSLDTKDFNITFEKPETITSNQSMTLLKANETLADMAALEKSVTYQYEPLSGVTIDAVIRNSLEAKSGKVTLTAVSNKADKLTFNAINWMDKGAAIDHKTVLNNVSFDGADVDTSKIAFTNKDNMKANSKMTLVSDFGDSVGTITGSKYKVGTAYEGEGSAYLEGSDLVFKTKTSAGLSDETHTTVMAMEAGIAALAAGNEHIGSVMESLGNPANKGSDGVSTAVSVGGGSSRYETGSHVDTNSWNISVAVGKNLEKKDGTLEYGMFGEYGRGNYTLHMKGVEDAGSGNTHYTGGGLLLKWTNSHDVYTEASFRMGSMKDKASSILHDGAGFAYGYDTSAKYRGGHFGIGKICREEGGTKLDIYGKYFYNEREGINFAAGADQYSLDEVRSRMLRAGFRYSITQKKWNRYGGLSYDYEFGGESTGTVNGMAIRSASVKGGTLRGEFGYCREATKTNPWKTDVSLYGFTGKRQGFGGSIAVEYHF